MDGEKCEIKGQKQKHGVGRALEVKLMGSLNVCHVELPSAFQLLLNCCTSMCILWHFPHRRIFEASGDIQRAQHLWERGPAAAWVVPEGMEKCLRAWGQPQLTVASLPCAEMGSPRTELGARSSSSGKCTGASRPTVKFLYLIFR